MAFCLTSTAHAEPPLGAPIPGKPTLADLLSTSSESGDVQGIVPTARACESAPHRAIALPADDAAHNSVQYEYWWWFGHTTARDGRRLAFIVIFYSKPWARVQEVQYAITDLSRGTFHQAVEPLIRTQRNAVENGFALRGDHAVARGGNGRDALRIEVDGYRLDLSLAATKRPVPHFGDGHAAPYCQSAYTYSRPRMRVVGVLRHGGATVRVRGTNTFEHLWGFAPAAPVASWVHMNFALRDGRDVLLFFVKAVDDKLASWETGWISDARGKLTTLHRGDFTVTPGRIWRRDPSCSYPVEWNVTVKGLRLHARAALNSTELRAAGSPLSLALWPEFPALWDGPMVVRGDARGVGWNDLGHPCWA
jgi:predicted secreted hydrolase